MTQLHDAGDQLERAECPLDVQTAQHAMLTARRSWASATTALHRHMRTVSKDPAWLHHHERPSPTFTLAMRKPNAARSVAALRHPLGHLVPPGAGQADIMGRHYAAISKAAQPDHVALQHVIGCHPWPGT
jgi:hypothetical protein